MFDALSSDMITDSSLDKLLGTIGAQLHNKIARFTFPMSCNGKISFKGIILPIEENGMAEI